MVVTPATEADTRTEKANSGHGKVDTAVGIRPASWEVATVPEVLPLTTARMVGGFTMLLPV